MHSFNLPHLSGNNGIVGIPMNRCLFSTPVNNLPVTTVDVCEDLDVIEPLCDRYLEIYDYPRYVRKKHIFTHILTEPDVRAINKGDRWKKALIGRAMHKRRYYSRSKSSPDYTRGNLNSQ